MARKRPRPPNPAAKALRTLRPNGSPAQKPIAERPERLDHPTGAFFFEQPRTEWLGPADNRRCMSDALIPLPSEV